MRILVLTNLYPNPWQPHRAAFNRQQFAALAQQHEVRVIAPVAWTDEWSSRAVGSQQRVILRDGMTVEHPRYVFPPKVLRSWHGRFYLRSVRPVFERAVNGFRPDVVLASWAYPDAWAAVELARDANLPIVAKAHGSDVLLLDQYPARRKVTADALAKELHEGKAEAYDDLRMRSSPSAGNSPTVSHNWELTRIACTWSTTEWTRHCLSPDRSMRRGSRWFSSWGISWP